MKLWYTIIIPTFIMVYGSLSLTLLGNWAYAKARALRDDRRTSTDKLGGYWVSAGSSEKARGSRTRGVPKKEGGKRDGQKAAK